MRLKQIKIVNFGQFSDQTFDLPSDKIDVFFGANEAGKSTTVAFIKDEEEKEVTMNDAVASVEENKNNKGPRYKNGPRRNKAPRTDKTEA